MIVTERENPREKMIKREMIPTILVLKKLYENKSIEPWPSSLFTILK